MPRVPEADQEELTECFRSLARELSGYATAQTKGDRSLADDLVQQAFHAAALSWAKVRDLPEERRLFWLKRVVSRRAIDAFRRDETARKRQADLVVPHGLSTHDAAMLSMAGTAAWAAIRALPRRQYLVAVLRFVDQLSVRVIAAELEVSPSTVSQDLKRIRSVVQRAANEYLDLGGQA